MNHIIRALSTCLLFFLVTNAFAQNLERKATLGIGIITLNDSVARANSISAKSGVLVTRVVPNTTSASLGIKQGDVILGINEFAISDRSQVFGVSRSLRENDELEITILRGNEKNKVSGKALGKPIEVSKSGKVIYGNLEYKNSQLRTIIHKPVSEEKSPVIFFLQGIYCGSQDFWAVPSEPAKLLIDDWVDAGYTVYRVERPGIGDSEGTKHCRDIDYQEELEIHRLAYNDLLQLNYVDTSQVFLFGHSMGSITAPILTEIHPPKGIIVYGAVYESWFEYFLENFRTQPIYYGVETRVQMDQMIRNSIPILYQWLVMGKSPQEIKNDPKNKRFVDTELNALIYSEGDYFFGRHYNFWYTMNGVNNALSWSKVNSKVLALYGSSDIQALNSKSARDIVAAVNEINPGNGTFLEIESADHSFGDIASKKEGAILDRNGEYIEHIRANYNSDISAKTIDWMRSVDQ